MDSILLSKQNGVAHIILNRPQVFNAMNTEMRKLLLQRLEDCEQDPSVRAILITGAGKAFCAGQDLVEATQENKPMAFNDALTNEYNPIVLKIRQLEKPVVAAVNGVAAGAGANIALVCDIVLASQSANFIQIFSKIGLIPDCGGTWILPRLVGFGRASAFMMLADKITAAEAQAMGMIYKVFPTDTLTAEAVALTQKLAQMPTKGLALTKKALNESMFLGLENQLIHEADLQKQAGATADYTEGVNAFIEKRQPTFKGC